MSYIRVVPRDLFNEAKLLKCLGALYIAAEYRNGDLTVEHANEGSREGWDIQEDESDGSIFVRNVTVTFRGKPLYCFSPLNSRRSYPLYVRTGDDSATLFNEDGTFSADFLDFLGAQ